MWIVVQMYAIFGKVKFVKLIPSKDEKSDICKKIFVKSLTTIGLLILSNVFMTLAWYGHLKFKDIKGFDSLSLMWIVIISWSIALFEYMFQVPANRVGYQGNGGPFSLVELKVLQEVITLTIFVVFSLVVFKNETFRMNHLIGFVFLILAVYFIFKK
ncbi:MAG: hypothetical protein FD155_2411 [Bacteroidetes bacterium]|nr:MAG: hypothetical protein FD155_2411 [Bacteroidota bacterium]